MLCALVQARLGGQEWQAPHVLPRRGSRRHDGRVVARSQVGLRLGFPGGTFTSARMCFFALVVALFCIQVAEKTLRGNGKGASGKAGQKRTWPEAASQWESKAAKGGGKRPKGKGKGAGGKSDSICFHCQEKGHWTGICPKKQAGEPPVPRKAKDTAA